jgi:anti-anti-sigma factor
VGGGLFFATAEALEDRVRELAEDDSHRHALVLDLEGVNFIDSWGAAKMTELHDLAEADGVTLRLARVKPQVLAVLEADGIVERIGAATSTATSTSRSKRSWPTPTVSARQVRNRHWVISPYSTRKSIVRTAIARAGRRT